MRWGYRYPPQWRPLYLAWRDQRPRTDFEYRHQTKMFMRRYSVVVMS